MRSRKRAHAEACALVGRSACRLAADGFAAARHDLYAESTLMTSSNRPAIGLGEFVGLMATLTVLVAMSIDMVLPALPAIGASLGVEQANDNQLIVSLLFLGFGVGQLFYGPLSDAAGRKPAAYIGLALFSTGCLLALLSRTFPLMLAGRFLQGIGVAGPRTITMALVRDKFEGREMARVMSLITAVFILGPIVAPALGQAILGLAGWRAIFGVYLAMALLASAWFALRQEETLPGGRRIPFSAAADRGRRPRGPDQPARDRLHGGVGVRVRSVSRIPDLGAADPAAAIRAGSAVSRSTSRSSRSPSGRRRSSMPVSSCATACAPSRSGRCAASARCRSCSPRSRAPLPDIHRCGC